MSDNYLAYLAGRKPGFYIVDTNHNDTRGGLCVQRGPYKHAETAGAVRAEIEANASDRRNKLWNLAVYEVEAGTPQDPPHTEKPPEKPPLGFIPKWQWLEFRLADIVAAISRYLDVDRPVPDEWWIEQAWTAEELGRTRAASAFRVDPQRAAPSSAAKIQAEQRQVERRVEET